MLFSSIRPGRIDKRICLDYLDSDCAMEVRVFLMINGSFDYRVSA
jgi:hypothetical protein